MEEGFGLAKMNIEFLKLKFSLSVFFMLLGLWISFILFVYFLRRYWQVIREDRKLENISDKSILEQKNNMKDQLLNSSGEQFVKWFLEYFEKFVCIDLVENIGSLLVNFSDFEKKNVEEVIYANQKLSDSLEKKMKKLLNSLW